MQPYVNLLLSAMWKPPFRCRHKIILQARPSHQSDARGYCKYFSIHQCRPYLAETRKLLRKAAHQPLSHHIKLQVDNRSSSRALFQRPSVANFTIFGETGIHINSQLEEGKTQPVEHVRTITRSRAVWLYISISKYDGLISILSTFRRRAWEQALPFEFIDTHGKPKIDRAISPISSHMSYLIRSPCSLSHDYQCPVLRDGYDLRAAGQIFTHTSTNPYDITLPQFGIAHITESGSWGI